LSHSWLNIKSSWQWIVYIVSFTLFNLCMVHHFMTLLQFVFFLHWNKCGSIMLIMVPRRVYIIIHVCDIWLTLGLWLRYCLSVFESSNRGTLVCTQNVLSDFFSAVMFCSIVLILSQTCVCYCSMQQIICAFVHRFLF